MRPMILISAGSLALAGAALGARPVRAHALGLLENLPLIGASGGTSFSRNCPSGQVLTGFRWRTGVAVDGLGIKCSVLLSDGSLGAETNAGEMAGGNGGTPGSDHCRGGAAAGQNGATTGVSLG